MWTGARRHGERAGRAAVRRLLAAGLLLAGAAPAAALSTDSGEPIAIEADRAERDDARRVTIYRGNVIIDQGSLRITGDTVTIHFDARGDVTKIVSVGAPAHFRQLPDGDTVHRKAWGKRIEYFNRQDLIVLLGDARYAKGGDEVRAERLAYDALNARFKALADVAADAPAGGGAPEKKPERVRIRIEREKDPAQ